MMRVLLMAAGAPLLLTACNDLTGSDSITLRAGNALHANAALQAVDPMHRRADRRQIDASGKYVAEVMKRYAPPSTAGDSDGTNGISIEEAAASLTDLAPQ